ncbi:MAG: DUF1697 domain-containing protein [Bacillota bacterium]
MARYTAFLRAINVGGHTVKMDQLRSIFEKMGFSNVETFLASGNVVFDSSGKNIKLLEQNIEKSLNEALGYNVAVFIRPLPELPEIAECRPFKGAGAESETGGGSIYIGFLKDEPAESVKNKLLSLQSENEEFRISGKELYWLCRIKFSESVFSGPLLEKTLRMQITLRNSTTVKKMVAKLS